MNEIRDLMTIIRESVMSNLIEKSGSFAGSDLNDVKLSIIQIKDVLYKTLMDIEIDKVKVVSTKNKTKEVK